MAFRAGASILTYYYSGYYSYSATLQGMSLLSSQAAASTTALTATFSLVLPAAYTPAALDVIFAHGNVASDGTPQQHSVRKGRIFVKDVRLYIHI